MTASRRTAEMWMSANPDIHNSLAFVSVVC